MGFSVLLIIILITSVISIHGFSDAKLFDKLHFSAYRIKHNKEYYRFVSNVLIHADLTHLLFNMFSLYFLGGMLEDFLISEYNLQIGEMHFILIYILGAVFANSYAYFKHQNRSQYRSVGASGAVSAIIFAAIMWNPGEDLRLLILPIPIPAFIFGPLYLAFEFWAHKKGNTGIAHDAHIAGAIFGVIYILIINIDKGKEFLGHIF